MDSVLDEGEDRLDLIRTAIDREIKRRERASKSSGHPENGPGASAGNSLE